jgi:hypothetical protein
MVLLTPLPGNRLSGHGTHERNSTRSAVAEANRGFGQGWARVRYGGVGVDSQAPERIEQLANGEAHC